MPTATGRKRMDEIKGLKMFMEVAEKHPLNSMNAPDLTPQLFEKLFPYAVALNVENQWGEKFDSILEKAMQNNEYRPTSYRDSTGSVFHANAFASTLGSNFSSSISSASISPQSSGSSGSGGGFSGGSGGCGGGGGLVTEDHHNRRQNWYARNIQKDLKLLSLLHENRFF